MCSSDLFKEFRNSKEKIATNVLTNRLKTLVSEGLIEKLDPTGTKKVLDT